MLALLSVWFGLASLVYALSLVFWRRFFNDVNITVALYAAIFSLTFAGLTLWSLRKREVEEVGVREQRLQAWVGSALSVVAICCVYGLIARAAVEPRPTPSPPYRTPATTTHHL